MEDYFIAIEPDEEFNDFIEGQKETVKNLIRDQEYLCHPPHMTLYIFKIENPEELFEDLINSSNELQPLTINLNDFHIFYNDPLTNGHTIAYSFKEEDNDKLKNIQLKIINTIKSKIKKLISINDDVYSRYGDLEKSNIIAFGYPYVGENWIPHITVSSIEKERFEEVFNELKKSPYPKKFIIKSICLYKVDEPSILIKRFKL